MVLEIQKHTSILNREVGELIARILMLEKIVFAILIALVVNVGVSAFKWYKDNKNL